MKREDLINQRATTCRHSGHCEWMACDKCNHYESRPETILDSECDDCISRRAILDLVVSNRIKLNELDVVMYASLCKDIKDLPSVTKEKTEWIPVSERVPQECIHTYDNNFHDYTRSESVLVTVRNKITNSEYVFHDSAYISNGEWYIDGRYDHERFKNCLVLAWRPLPKPYKPQESEEQE